MMGETGPCGPCSELHIDLTPAGDTKGALVNKGTAECIEIWNLVFIQFNANPDGTFSPLPARHVDTGMGFERVASIIQGTRDFTDFANAKISNYETDIFRPIFDELEKMSGHRYDSTLPQPNAAGQIIPTSEQEKVDVAFRVIADHIRTLSFAIADGIQPGNTDRNYVLRRILRRAVRYGRALGFHEPFFYKLVDILARTMGDVFPEIRAKQKHVEEVLKREEEAFNKTLDRGIKLFENQAFANALSAAAKADGFIVNHEGYYSQNASPADEAEMSVMTFFLESQQAAEYSSEELRAGAWKQLIKTVPAILGVDAFKLYDTYGFPLDLTELMARERGLGVQIEGFGGFNDLMEQQKARARAAQKKQIIELSEVETKEPTKFVGYDSLSTPAEVLEVVSLKDKTAVVLDASACYAEMGGQVGDTGEISAGDQFWRVINTQKTGHTWLHFIGSSTDLVGDPTLQASEASDAPEAGMEVVLSVDAARRGAIQRHHTVTHLLHWALHEVVSHEATQKGSFVGPDKLTFDFNSAALTPVQVRDIERLVNGRIVDNAAVSWIEMPYAEVRGRADIMQFFGDKYGETVRVVQIGGEPAKLNGYSMELCAGTHTRATGEIGLFRINAEAAIAAGVRRIEAVAGLHAYDLAAQDTARLHALATKIGTPLPELEKRIDGLLAHQKELEKTLKAAQQREAAGRAKDLLASAETINGTPTIIANLGSADGDTLQTVADALKSHGFKGVAVLGGTANGAVALVASVSSDFTAKAQAGKIIQTIAPLVGGKGGGKPEGARGGGKDPSQLDAALAHAKTLLG